MASKTTPGSGKETPLMNYLQSVGFKPVTTNNILYYYLPANGVLCYTGLSINIMNPSAIARLFPRRDITNILLFGAWVGTGLYIYSSKHIRQAPQNTQIMYSGFGASIFSLGSVLLWAVMRNALPRNNVLCTAVGIASGVVLLRIGRDYLQFIDSHTQVTQK